MRIYSLAFLSLFVININTNAGAEAHGSIDFYGHKLNIMYDYSYSTLEFRTLDQQEFNRYTELFRNRNLIHTMELLESQMQLYALDDIGTVLLIDKFVMQHIASGRQNERTFIKYLLLKELGYDVILTRTGNSLNCLGNLSFTPGRYIYIQYNNKVYKDLDFAKRVQKGKHFIFMDKVKTFRTMSRNPLNLPKISAKKQHKHLQFRHASKQYELDVTSNESVLEFLTDLPMYSIGNEYTKLRLSAEMRNSLIPYLQEQTSSMKTAEKAQFLLAFVQQVIPYGSDLIKYGEERYYYPEQTIMASTADCEDKTFLLSYLAREVAGLQSVALYFENDEHLGIGLQIPNYEDSYSFKYQGKYYVACEPTAKTARLGHSAIPMNRVTKVTPL